MAAPGKLKQGDGWESGPSQALQQDLTVSSYLTLNHPKTEQKKQENPQNQNKTIVALK